MAGLYHLRILWEFRLTQQAALCFFQGRLPDLVGKNAYLANLNWRHGPGEVARVGPSLIATFRRAILPRTSQYGHAEHPANAHCRVQGAPRRIELDRDRWHPFTIEGKLHLPALDVQGATDDVPSTPISGPLRHFGPMTLDPAVVPLAVGSPTMLVVPNANPIRRPLHLRKVRCEPADLRTVEVFTGHELVIELPTRFHQVLGARCDPLFGRTGGRGSQHLQVAGAQWLLGELLQLA
mmetsp:Transcript_128373/g.286051  ORF Transcript_128373/g.286051 Transcript_128373/m.286051 type:complete len:237 (-) Transcript_128373:56-766(-)